jgi:hypothetical protein
METRTASPPELTSLAILIPSPVGVEYSASTFSFVAVMICSSAEDFPTWCSGAAMILLPFALRANNESINTTVSIFDSSLLKLKTLFGVSCTSD